MRLISKHTFNGTIRTIRADNHHTTMCIEELSEEQIPVYHLLNLETYQLVVDDLIINDNISTALAAISGSSIICTHYLNNQNPDQTGIIIYDFKKQLVVWEHSSTRLIKIGRNYIEVPHPHFKDKTAFINIDLGHQITNEQELIDNEPNNCEIFPLTYTQESEHFKLFQKFLVSSVQHIPVGACEYLEFQEYLCISYFRQSGKVFENYILIARTSGEVIACMEIDKNLKGIAKDTFFILDNQLIFVSNKGTLNIYEF